MLAWPSCTTEIHEGRRIAVKRLAQGYVLSQQKVKNPAAAPNIISHDFAIVKINLVDLEFHAYLTSSVT